MQRPVRRDVLRQKLIAYFEQPQQDRRKNPRKQGISQLWISAYNTELGTTELFESPFLIDISRSGLSFQSHVEYPEQQIMAVWIVSEDYPDRIIDLRGHVRWRRQDAGAEAAGTQMYKYGVEFIADESEGFLNFAKMIAMHSG
ncbi:MAG: PilZ domain-containing protein [Turneriella sp.]